MNGFRFWTVILLLLTTALLLYCRSDSEPSIAAQPLSQFPVAIAEWKGEDQQIDPESLQILGKGEFLTRVYSHKGNAPPIGLFIAYYRSQRIGMAVHSPKNCLPGAGWIFESSEYADLKDSGGKVHRVGEYVIADGVSRNFLIYWYQGRGRSIANEYIAKLYSLADGVRTGRSDGALVRVMTPIDPSQGNDAGTAKARAEAFVAQLFPLLPRSIPN